jgi:hypothetical protein
MKATPALLTSVLFFVQPALRADDPAAAEASRWQAHFHQIASEYVMTTAGEKPRELTWLDRPIMKWTQPVRGGEHGSIFLWLDGKRPAAIGMIFTWPHPSRGQAVTHEVQTLADEPLKGVWKQRTWSPPGNSIRWEPMPDAPAPVESGKGRDLELRRISRRFNATSESRQGQKRELRLLPTPIYRYDSDAALGSGAMFGFVEGTDLETVLLVEARATDDGPRWHFGFARMSDLRLNARRDEQSVWEVNFASYDVMNAAYSNGTAEYLREPPQISVPGKPK